MDFGLVVLRFLLNCIPILSIIYVIAGFMLLQRNNWKKVNYFSLTIFALAIYSFGYFLELNCEDYQLLLYIRGFEFLGNIFIPSTGILFIEELTKGKVSKGFRIVLLSISGALWIAFITNPFHHLIYKSVTTHNVNGFHLVTTERAFLFYVILFYFGVFIAYSTIQLFVAYKAARTTNRKRSMLFLLCVFQAPWATIIIILLGLDQYIDPVSLTIMVMCTFFLLNEINNDMFELQIKRWRNSFEHIDEPAFLLNNEGFMVCENDSAVFLLQAYGKYMDDIIEEIDTCNQKHEPISLIFNQTVFWFEINKNVFDKKARFISYLLIDITERKRALDLLRESEKNFKTFFETMDDMIMVTDVYGKIIYANGAVSKKLGYSLDELLSMHRLDVYPPERRRDVDQNYKEIFEGNKIFCDIPFISREEMYLPTETRVWFGKWDDQDAVYSVSKDLSIQQAALDKFHKLFDYNPALMALISLPERKLTEVNIAFLNILGYTRDEVIGRTAEELDLFEDKDIPTKVSDILQQVDMIRDLEVKIRKKDGGFITGLYSGGIIDNQMERSLLTVATDVTDLKRTEEELLRAKEKAEYASMTKSQFLANMSHEIRTPMNAIIGFLELMQTTNPTEDQKEYIKEAKTASKSLLHLINDILDLSKIEAGKLTMEEISFNLRTMIEDTVFLLVPKATKKGLDLLTMIKANVPEEVMGDPSRLRQILNNLVSNALKFTEKGEVLVTVSNISHENGISFLRFEVKDNGIGISEKDIQKLFKSFSQADASTTRKYGGSGLGLAISKELVELMHGAIQVNSEVGQGSTFSFTIPLKISNRNIDKKIEIESLNGIHVLVIEGQVSYRTIISETLISVGCIVSEFDSLESAVQGIKEGHTDRIHFDVAIVSVDLTESQIFESLGNMKKILLTSAAKKGDAQIAKKMGYSGYLVKPIKRDELLNCMRIVLGLKEDEVENDPIVTKYTAKELAEAKKPKLLLVEDKEANRKLVQIMLNNHGLHCDVAVNGEEAYLAIRDRDYDIVFMDCQMPVMDGYQATEQIRQDEGNKKHTRIIAMTANAMEGDRDRCIAAGMDDYISKPIHFPTMFKLIDEYMKQK